MLVTGLLVGGGVWLASKSENAKLYTELKSQQAKLKEMEEKLTPPQALDTTVPVGTPEGWNDTPGAPNTDLTTYQDPDISTLKFAYGPDWQIIVNNKKINKLGEITDAGHKGFVLYSKKYGKIVVTKFNEEVNYDYGGEYINAAGAMKLTSQMYRKKDSFRGVNDGDSPIPFWSYGYPIQNKEGYAILAYPVLTQENQRISIDVHYFGDFPDEADKILTQVPWLN